ncbi:hypothetical protein [Chachezhania sediminis]|nr:hypothetical protein [Chachezhania sediminis]
MPRHILAAALCLAATLLAGCQPPPQVQEFVVLDGVLVPGPQN